MPNISFWISDDDYRKWLDISTEQQTELRKSFKQMLQKKINNAN